MEGFYYRTENSGSTAIALTATGDDWTVTAMQPLDVIRVGFLVTTTFSSSGDTVVKFDLRPTAGSDTGRGDGDVATMNIPTTTAAGTLWTVELEAPIQVDAGEQIVAEVATASTSAGSGIYMIQYQPRPFQGDATMTAAQGNRIANVTVET